MNNTIYEGDTVRVSNPSLKSYNKTGLVTIDYGSVVEVQIEGFCGIVFKKSNLTLVKRNKSNSNRTIKEDKSMVVKGNYNVAEVTFINGTSSNRYCFALFDENITVGDTVLVDTVNGYSVAVVENIISKEIAESEDYALPTKEVVCKVDFTAFNERKDKRAKAAKLKSDMDKKVKSLQEIAVFELLAEKSPELREMLTEYKSLIE